MSKFDNTPKQRVNSVAMIFKAMFLFIFISSRIFCVGKLYINYTLYRVIPMSQSHINYFLKMKDYYDVVFWREPGSLYYPFEFVISPEERQYFLNEAAKYGIHYTKVIDNVQSVFDEQTIPSYTRTWQAPPMNWHGYYRLDVIYRWLKNLSETHNEELELHSIGETYEYRQILALRIALRGAPKRSTVIIEGGIHAREWISIAFVNYLINAIVNARTSNDATLKKVALSYEWYIVPVLNPDGYEYSFTKDRLWRKNRHDGGVDLNRNFPFAFGTVGTSWKSRSHVYCGRKAFSERESRAMAKLVISKNSTLEYYINFHSYGQHICISYANSKLHLDNYDEVFKMCSIAANKIKARYRTRYNCGTVYETVGYLASGGSSCWVKKNFNVPYVVTFELRDTGNEGFALHHSKILPTCEETLDGLISFLVPRKENFTKLSRTSSKSCKILSPSTMVILDFFVIIAYY